MGVVGDVPSVVVVVMLFSGRGGDSVERHPDPTAGQSIVIAVREVWGMVATLTVSKLLLASRGVVRTVLCQLPATAGTLHPENVTPPKFSRRTAITELGCVSPEWAPLVTARAAGALGEATLPSRSGLSGPSDGAESCSGVGAVFVVLWAVDWLVWVRAGEVGL